MNKKRIILTPAQRGNITVCFFNLSFPLYITFKTLKVYLVLIGDLKEVVVTAADASKLVGGGSRLRHPLHNPADVAHAAHVCDVELFPSVKGEGGEVGVLLQKHQISPQTQLNRFTNQNKNTSIKAKWRYTKKETNPNTSNDLCVIGIYRPIIRRWLTNVNKQQQYKSLGMEISEE